MSIWEKIFGKENKEESLEEVHKLSSEDVSKGKKSGKINGDPIIIFGK